MINRGTIGSETLTIKSQSYITGAGSYSVDLSAFPKKVNYTPNHVYVNISIPLEAPIDANSNYGLTVNTTKWVTVINITPKVSYYRNFTLTSGSLSYIDLPNYTGSDLTISIFKANIPTMQGYVVSKNIVNGTLYTIDLMDSAYGLNSVTLPGDSIRLVVDEPQPPIMGNGNITYDFTEQMPYTNPPIPLGAIEYIADNYYWIPQTYYYQMGGVFLKQSDGNTTYKLPPEISFSYDYGSDISTVNINALAITDPTGGSVVGGNSPVQIKTTLVSKYALPYAVGTTNTKWIKIGVNTSDEQAGAMWKNYFNYTARIAFEGSSCNYAIGNTANESYIFIYGSDTSDSIFDINVIASNATYLATVYGVG